MSWKDQSSRTNNGKNDIVNSLFSFSDNPESLFPSDVLIIGDLTIEGKLNYELSEFNSINIGGVNITKNTEKGTLNINSGVDIGGDLTLPGDKELSIGNITIANDDEILNISTGVNIGDTLSIGNITIANANEILNISTGVDIGGTLSIGDTEITHTEPDTLNISTGVDINGTLSIGGTEITHIANGTLDINTGVNIEGNLTLTEGSSILIGTDEISIDGFTRTDVLRNTAVGESAFEKNDNGAENSAFGALSLSNNITGKYNSAFGVCSLSTSTESDVNTAVGTASLFANTDGTNNSAFGSYSLKSNINGSNNSAFGSDALFENTSGSDNSAFGVYSLSQNATGSNNSAFGIGSLSNNNGSNNTSVGSNSLFENTTGSDNSAFGRNALYYNTGINNTSVGSNSLFENTTGSDNSAFGRNALYYNTGINNTAVGAFSLQNSTTGKENTAVGHEALVSNTTGSFNTAVGVNAMRVNTVGNKNTIIGYHDSHSTPTGIENCSAVGYNAGAFINTSNMIRLGNDLISLMSSKVSLTSGSDVRFKTDINDIDIGLDFINELRPVSYRLVNDERKQIEYGIIAQELHAVMKNHKISPCRVDNASCNTGGMVCKDAQGYYYVRYNDFIPILMKSVQELDSKIQINKISEPQFIDCDVDGNIPDDLILTLSNEYHIWQIKIDELILNPNESKSFKVTYGDSLISNSIITCDLVNNFNPTTGDVSPMSLTIGNTGDPKRNNKKIWITNINNSEFHGSVEMIIKSTK